MEEEEDEPPGQQHHHHRSSVDVTVKTPPICSGGEKEKKKKKDASTTSSSENRSAFWLSSSSSSFSTSRGKGGIGRAATEDDEEAPTRRRTSNGFRDAEEMLSPSVALSHDLFDAFAFTTLCDEEEEEEEKNNDAGGKTKKRGPLVRVSMFLFERFVPDVMQKLSEGKVEAWARAIEASYGESIDYHNRAHATDVTQGLGYILENGLREELEDVEVFALICTAMAHDCGHPGKSNLFLVETKSEKAKKWNNEAVNENGHVEYAIDVFEKCGVFTSEDDIDAADDSCKNKKNSSTNNSENNAADADDDENGKRAMKETVYEILKTAILYTDMNKHETLIEKFREALERNKGKKAIKEWEKKEDVHVALGYVLHCADVLNGCRPWPVANKWAELITEEFCKQGDVEKSLGFQKLTGAHVDRALRTDITSSRQAIKFAEETVKPLYGLLKEIVPDAVAPLLTQLELNEAKHRALIQESTCKVSNTTVGSNGA